MQARTQGDMVGRYRLEELIGRGGMGEVWRAFDERLKRTVAVKSARTGDGRAADTLKAGLETEAQNAARLHHPGIVEVFDFVDDGDTCWIVMEYVSARSLAQIIDDRGTLPPEETAAIGRQLAEALAVSHSAPARVVHGDITPENVLVRDDGTAKLTDFGISRAVGADPTSEGAGGVRGKLRYLPPEVARGRRSNEKSDMFSLGATLYAAVEGRSPYGEAESAVNYLARAYEGEVVAPRRAGELTPLLTALLSTEPRRRPTAARAARLLARVAPPGESADDPNSRDGHTWTSLTLPLRRARTGAPWYRRPGVRSVSAVLVTAAAVAAVLVLRPDGGGPGTPGAGPSGRAPSARPADAGAMGDARTADPCGLLAPETFTRYGASTEVDDYGEFDRCDILVSRDPDEGPVADITLDFASEPTAPDSQHRPRRVGVVGVTELPGSDDECERNLQLPDGNQIWISAEREDRTAPDLCTLADAATRYATARLNKGPVPRRPGSFPGFSLARLHACEDLLTPASLSVVPGLGTGDPEHGFADWQCTWSGDTAKEEVDLLFNRDNDLADDGDHIRLSGVDAYVAPGYDGPHTCVVMTVRHTYQDTAGNDTVEYVHLRVAGARPTGQLCDTAKDLSAAVARKLQTL